MVLFQQTLLQALYTNGCNVFPMNFPVQNETTPLKLFTVMIHNVNDGRNNKQTLLDSGHCAKKSALYVCKFDISVSSFPTDFDYTNLTTCENAFETNFCWNSVTIH